MNAAASTQHKEQLQYLFINKPNSITMGDLYRLYDFNGEGDSHVNVRVQKSLLNILFPPSAFNSEDHCNIISGTQRRIKFISKGVDHC